MRFFADENIARAIVLWLRENGNDVLYGSEEKPGAPDVDWLKRAEDEQRLLFTSDKDFGELVFRDGLNSHGVILMRLGDLSIEDRVARLKSVWSVIQANPAGKFIVVTASKVRVRPLPSSDANGEEASPEK
jgi:predicted nuclease of predicted toxin-antitoxin system